jgi:hypothetical protein
MNDKEKVYNVIREAIIQSTKNPEYVSVSSVTLSDRLNIDHEAVERYISELVSEGRLVQKSMPDVPMHDVFVLPE